MAQFWHPTGPRPRPGSGPPRFGRARWPGPGRRTPRLAGRPRRAPHAPRPAQAEPVRDRRRQRLRGLSAGQLSCSRVGNGQARAAGQGLHQFGEVQRVARGAVREIHELIVGLAPCQGLDQLGYGPLGKPAQVEALGQVGGMPEGEQVLPVAAPGASCPPAAAAGAGRTWTAAPRR